MSRSRTSRLPKDSPEDDPRTARKAREKDIDKDIDRAVEMTFPASDAATPGHATSTEPPMRPADRQAPVISKDDIEAAAKGTGHARNASPRLRRLACPYCGGLGKIGGDTCPKCAGIGSIPAPDSSH